MAGLGWLPRVDQQDAWLFLSSISSTTVALRAAEASIAGGNIWALGQKTSSLPPWADLFDFELGRLRSDNRISQLLTEAGITVINPSLSVRARHLQLASGGAREYAHRPLLHTVSGTGRMVPVSLDWEYCALLG